MLFSTKSKDFHPAKYQNLFMGCQWTENIKKKKSESHCKFFATKPQNGLLQAYNNKGGYER